MISPEGYYEEHLKGKSAEQIMTAIRGLKQEIGHLKNTMEHPEYAPMMHPSESTRLCCTRLYLERAKEALAEAGGTYIPSRAELKVAAFEESIPAIYKVVFSIGGFFGGYETRTYTLDEPLHMDIVDIEHSVILKPTNFYIEPNCPISKDEFLEGLRELHIGEWRTRYDLRRFGYMVCDGTQWELEIYFSNGHKPVKIYGDNAYPYNFRKFQELLGIEPFDEEDEDE